MVLKLPTLKMSSDGTKPDRAELDRTLDVEVEVLEVRQAVLADRVEQHVDAVPRAVGAASGVRMPRFERIALARVVERRHVERRTAADTCRSA